MTTYSTGHIAKRLHIAASSVRNYARDSRITPYLSATATPGPGQARQFTDSDLRVFAFVAAATDAGQSLDQVAQRLAASEHTAQDIPLTEEERNSANANATALTVVSNLTSALQNRDQFLEALQRHEAREAALQQRIEDLVTENARLQTLLETSANSQRLSWSQRLFGRR